MAKEQTLWDTEEIQDTVTLTMPDRDTFKKGVDFVGRGIDESRLKDIVKLLETWLKNKHIVLKSPQGEVVKNTDIESFFASKKWNAKKAVDFVAVMLSDSENIRLMIGQCPVFVKNTIERLLDCFYLSAKELYLEVYGPSLLGRKAEWYGAPFYLRYPWFSLFYGFFSEGVFGERGQGICLGRTLYHRFLTAFCEMPALPRKTISKEEGLRVLCTEKDVVTGYPVITNLYQKNVLALGTNDKMLVSVVRKCSKLVGLGEFFPSEKDIFLRNLRASFAFPAFYEMLAMSSKKKLLPLEMLLKEYAYSLFTFGEGLNLLLPHLKGLRLFEVDLENFGFLLDLIWDLLSEIDHPEEWISVRGLIFRILEQDSGFECMHLFSAEDFSDYQFRLENKRFDHCRIHYGNLRKDLSEPCVKGILVMLASIGLLDVAYRDYDAGDRSWVDWLEYVRLTHLGRYVFEYTEHYERSESGSEKWFDVDEERLIIRQLQEDNPFSKFLQEVAVPIGNHRWTFSEASFLQKCATKKDVEQKIDFLKQFVVTHPSAVWEDFFQRLLNRCHPLTNVSNYNYMIYRLNPKDKALLHLFATDEKLRQWVIRAEGYLILVEDEDREKFLRRMKTLGYVL